MQMEKGFTGLWKWQALPTGQQTPFPQLRYSGSLRTFPQRLLRLPIPIRSYPKEYEKSGRTANRTNRKAVRPFYM